MIEFTRNVGEIMNENAFSIHGLDFTNKEIIQCALYCSRSIYQILSTEEGYGIDGLVITISPKQESVLMTPVKCKTPIKYQPTANKDKYKNEKLNTYTKFSDDLGLSMLLTKGYITDNFNLSECYHDFLLNEEESSVYITAQDIESLSVPNPEII